MNTTNQYTVTKHGLDEAIQTYTMLVKQKRPALVERLKQTIELGDTTENSEYDAVKAELAIVDTRINSLQQFIEKAQPVAKQTNHHVVDIGSDVTLRLNGRVFSYTVVGTWEVAVQRPMLSVTSPVGQAIQGKKAGYETLIQTPSGTVPLTIQAVG